MLAHYTIHRGYEKKPFVLRLSDDMFKKLEQWPAVEFRSVNGQIEFILHRAIM
jgi:hypothetical protein